MKTKSIVYIVIALVVVVGSVYLTKSDTPSETGNNSFFAGALSEDWVKGNPQAKVTIIEYSDFQCPACRSYFPVLSALSNEFGDKLAIVYRHFPLVSIHNNALLAAKASEAAGIQNSFWDMHDILFSKQDQWSDSTDAKKLFFEYANEIGIDGQKFLGDLSSKEIEKKVNNSYQTALNIGLNSTPSFFINGDIINNPKSYEEFKNLVESYIISNSSTNIEEISTTTNIDI